MNHPLTREQARGVAQAYADDHDLRLAGPMLDGATEPTALRLYAPPDDYPDAWWLSLAIHVSDLAIESSTVLGIHKATREVRRLGSASDEG